MGALLLLVVFLFAFGVVYVAIPRIIARCLNRLWPSAPTWKFDLSFELIIISLMAMGICFIFNRMHAAELAYVAETGEGNVGGNFMQKFVVVLVNAIGFPFCLWSGFSERPSRNDDAKVEE